ncbi:MAG: BrnA antitoxin family protein [Bifidobacterium tibiigranuli]|jgi:hypothetical protein|nr:BrnA antitoxin family protein [Bifidobacterium tibiigranuli]
MILSNLLNGFERNHYACDSGAQYPSALSVPLSVQLPEWLIEVLDREARRMGISRQTVMKVWLTERADPNKAADFLTAIPARMAAPDAHDVEGVRRAYRCNTIGAE